MDLVGKVKAWFSGPAQEPAQEPAQDMAANGPYGEVPNAYAYGVWDGEGYEGGLGPIPVSFTDYWALRQRSSEFFKTNLYGRGIIRRFITNVINTGLSLEADPMTRLIPLDERGAADWAEDVEDRFAVWAESADAVDWAGQMSFGRFQRAVEREALIEGDVLVIEHFNAATMAPSYELVCGASVRTPIDYQDKLPDGVTICYGVERDSSGRHRAYHVAQADLSSRRIPAYGESGRRIAWMVYGTDKRHNDVRGEPLLALVMQSIGEILQFRDSAQRKATIGAIMAMFFYQDPEAKTPNARSISAGAQRRVVGTKTAPDGSDHKVNIAGLPKGVVMETLAPGVEPRLFNSNGTDEKFKDFEGAILAAIAWGLEMPPSILQQVFGSSYSASRGEVKEFDMFLRVARSRFAAQLCKPIYTSWLGAKVLTRAISAPGYLDATRDPAKADTVTAWEMSNWWGQVKEAVDIVKEVQGRAAMAENGYSTHSANARALTGTSWRKNIKRVQRENEQIAEATRPMLELQAEFGTEAVDQALGATHGLRLVNSIEDDLK